MWLNTSIVDKYKIKSSNPSKNSQKVYYFYGKKNLFTVENITLFNSLKVSSRVNDVPIPQ